MVCGCGTEEEYDEKDGVKVALKQYEDRRTTDVLFLIGIIVMWVVMTIVGAISFAEGNPNRLIGPISSEVSESSSFPHFIFDFKLWEVYF